MRGMAFLVSLAAGAVVVGEGLVPSIGGYAREAAPSQGSRVSEANRVNLEPRGIIGKGPSPTTIEGRGGIRTMTLAITVERLTRPGPKQRTCFNPGRRR